MAEPIKFLVHRGGDDAAVAVCDVEPGEVRGAYLNDGTRVVIAVRDRIPLGHKVALRDITENPTIIEYGVPIAPSRQAIGAGDLVLTHNLRSARWQRSL